MYLPQSCKDRGAKSFVASLQQRKLALLLWRPALGLCAAQTVGGFKCREAGPVFCPRGEVLNTPNIGSFIFYFAVPEKLPANLPAPNWGISWGLCINIPLQKEQPVFPVTQVFSCPLLLQRISLITTTFNLHDTHDL